MRHDLALDPTDIDDFASPRARMVLVPEALRAPFSRLLGLGALAFTAFAAGSFVTWDATDPNVNHATSGEPANIFGWWGASLADTGFQLLGLAAPAALVACLVWGWHKARGRRIGGALSRLGLALAATVLCAAGLAAVAPPEGWPLTTVGLGGVTGDAVLASIKAFTGAYPSGVLGWILCAVFMAPAVWLAVLALRLPRGAREAARAAERARDLDRDLGDEWERPRSAAGERLAGALAMPAGLLAHVALAARATLARRLRPHMPRIGRPSWPKVRAPRAMPSMEEGFEAHAAPPIDMSADIEPTPRAGLKAAMMRAEAETRAHEEAHDVAHEPHAFDVTDEGWHVDAPAEEMPQKANRYARGASGIVSHRFDPETAPAAPHLESQDVPPMVSPEPPPSMPAPAPVQQAPVRAAQPAAQPAAPQTMRRTAPAPETFELPGTDLLAAPRCLVDDPSLSSEALEQNARTLEGVLADFGVKGHIVKVRPGPVVTLYELEPAPGIKASRVIGLADDIARSMEAIAARVAVVPGRNVIGIELPNKRRETVYLAEQLTSSQFAKTKAKLPVSLGKTIGGEAVVADLAKMPHLLVAGTTGSGKSVCINTLILSLLYRHSPQACRLIMIDPKMLELSIYDGIPHLLTPVVTDPKKAVVALKWTVREMEQRYAKMSKVGVRNIDGFNTRIGEAKARGEVITRTVQTGFDRETGEALYESEELDMEPMPYIVVVIDEMADLMMVAGKEIEGAVQRLAQMARAAGIHVVMATQRPSTDVITGTIKANFPTRFCFQVTSKIDSRVMLGGMGAEQLLGMGDMLYMAGGGRIQRVHGPFVSDEEVEAIVSHLKAQGVPDYLDAITEEDEEEEEATGGDGSAGDMGESDDPYDQAVAVVLRDRKVSTSYIQRRLGIGYNRAASLIERMEQEGVIGPANHAGKREILVPAEDETI